MILAFFFLCLGAYLYTRKLEWLVLAVAFQIAITDKEIKDDIKSTYVPCGSTDTNSVLVTPTK